MSRRRPPLPALLVACLAVGGCQRAVSDVAPTPAPFAAPVEVARTGQVDDPALPEISGLAVSRRHPGRLWAVNDSGNRPRLHLLGTDGGRLASLDVAGVENIDWEDLAAFELDGTPYLLIADIGDNPGRRSHVHLHVVEEPVVPRDGEVLRPVASLAFRYPDGPRDAEGVAVDAARGAILVLTKREAQPGFYRLPLRLDTPGETLVAEPVGRFDNPEPRFDPPGGPATRSLFGASPTAIDLDAAGRNLLLLTYTAIYRLEIASGASWEEALARPFAWLADHPLPQAEALAVAPSGDGLYFTSERLPAPVWRIGLAPDR
ncbi:MAG: hypothetical protein R3298_10450 [Gammaproteobacteria bacterium]|nr:hypothetical protein [Gammaproteobacteria bacterium]